MNNEHGVVFEMDFLFATCKLNENERVKVKDVIESELMVETGVSNEFNEENVKKQLRKIIPLTHNKDLTKVTEHQAGSVAAADDGDDIEVIKAVTAAEKSVSKDAELEQISKKRRLSGTSVASSGPSRVSTTITKPLKDQQTTNKGPPSDVTQFRVPTSFSIPSSVPYTPRKTPSVVTPRATPKKSPFLVPNSNATKTSFPLLVTPMKSKSNALKLQTPAKANLKTPMKHKTPAKNTIVLSSKTTMKTPQKSTADPIVPPSTVKKRNSGYAPHMYPCDECDKGYASSSARSQHKKNKHKSTETATAGVKQEKASEQEVLTSFPLLDQGNTDATSKVDTNVTKEAIKTSSSMKSVQESDLEKVPVQLFGCEGCDRSYPTSMKLKMHKKRSCKGGGSKNVKSEPDSSKLVENSDSLVATLEESVSARDTSEDEPSIDKTSKNVVDSHTSETDEIQNMLMLDNLDDDEEDDDDGEIELVDIIVDQKSKVHKEVPIGQIKNETQVDPNESAESKCDVEEMDDSEKTVKITKEEIKTETSITSHSMFEECLKSKYFLDHPSLFSKGSEDNLPTFQKPIKFLPGWKLKRNEVLKKNGERIPATHFLSPENIVIRSGLGVLEYLRIVGAKAEYLESLSLKFKVKPKNFENYVGKYLYDL